MVACGWSLTSAPPSASLLSLQHPAHRQPAHLPVTAVTCDGKPTAVAAAAAALRVHT